MEQQQYSRVHIPVILKGPSNYITWSRLTKTALGGRGLWAHITSKEAPKKTIQGEDGKKTEEIDEGKWEQEDLMVLSILQSSLDGPLMDSYSQCTTANQLWDTLHKVFGNTSNLNRIFEVKRAINTLQQEDGDFTKHLGKYSQLWAELEMLRPSSNDPAILEVRREEDKVFGLLLSLKPEFIDVVKFILRDKKLPCFDEVCAQLQKEIGSDCLFGGGKGGLNMAHQAGVEAASANKASVRPDSRRGTCDHCKKEGHKKHQCWILHPHLRPPSRFNQGRTHGATQQAGQQGSQPMRSDETGRAMASTSSQPPHDNGIIHKSDIEALIKALNANSGNIIGRPMHNILNTKPVIIDSGASHHMIKDSSLISNVEPALGSVVIANGDRIPIEGIGNLKLFEKESKAFYMPTFTSNLLSVKKASTDLNCNVIFSPNEVQFQDIETSKMLGKGVSKGGLYLLEDTKLPSSSHSVFTSVSAGVSDVLWHARLGHPHSRALGLMLPNLCFKNDSCEACILGKHCKTVFSKSSTIYKHCFDLIHSDVWTAPCLSRENHKYFVTFIDEKSKYTWLTLIPSKDRVLEAFMNFQSYVTNHFDAKIKIFRSDNGGEYTSNNFKNHLAKHGITHQTSCPYTPQQNGVAERKNRHLMEVARSMMFHTNVPKRFWGDAVVTACYLINRTPTRVLHDSSPYEVLNKTKPSINHLRVFGCTCFVLIPGEQRNKLEAKSIKAMFIGYSANQKGYKCYVQESNRVLVSRDVKFIESKGYYDEKSWDNLKDLSHAPSDRANNLRIILESLGISQPVARGRSSATPPPEDIQAGTEPTMDTSHLDPEGGTEPEQAEDTAEDTHQVSGDHDQDGQEEQTAEVEQQDNEIQEEIGETVPVQPLRRSTRIRYGPEHWKNTRVYFNANAVAHPIQAVCSLAQFPGDHQTFMSNLDHDWIPKTYEEAMADDEWRTSVEDEIGAMIKNDTWFESELPKGKKAVTSRLLYTIKYLANGKPERKKTRLVARGFTQTYGEDYLDTFAPVAKLHTIRILLSIATNLEWDLWQMDVKNAFLQGELEDEVYMRPPTGLEHMVKPGNVWRLKKAIYGLKQSPRAWYHKLSATLNGKGFIRSEADHTLFTLTRQQGIVVILVYVDDIIITGSDNEGIQETKYYLKSVFDIKDLGELKYFLGIEICRSKEGLFLSQRKYTLDLLDGAGMLGEKPAKTPLEDGYKILRKGEYDETQFDDPKQYRRLVGKLIYLTITRPDICFAVNQVSQHMQVPKVHHWKMVERILKYLSGAPGQGIWMGCNGNTEVVGYCDADWAGDRNDRKSTTGYCTFIGGNLVTWKSKKQKVVSCSSAEAEYRAMRKLTNELVWIKGLLRDLGVEITSPITIHCDNQAAIHIASNSVFHERTKHIEIDCHKVRQMVIQGVILPCYTRSEEQLADIFTKAASTKVCESIYPKLGLINIRHE